MRTLCASCHSKLRTTSLSTLATFDIKLLELFDKDQLLRVIKFQQDIIEFQQDIIEYQRNKLLIKEKEETKLMSLRAHAYAGVMRDNEAYANVMLDNDVEDFRLNGPYGPDTLRVSRDTLDRLIYPGYYINC